MDGRAGGRWERAVPSRRTHAVRVAILVAAAAAVACADGATEATAGRPEAERRWARMLGGASSYVMRQQRLCYCLHVDTVRLTVTGGRITAGVNERTGAELPADERGAYRSVEQLFDALDAVPAAGGRIVSVRFHPVDGYPTQLAVDPVAMLADDEADWRTVVVQRGASPP